MVAGFQLRKASNREAGDPLRRRHRRSDCPVHFALETFGDAWTLLVVRDLMFKGRTRYRDFLRAEEGIATNILADRLARLEEDGIVAREPDPARAGRGRYRLTPKGVDLLPVLLEIIDWSARHDPRTAADRGFVRRLRADKTGLAAEIRAELTAGVGGKRVPGRPRPRRSARTRPGRGRETEVPP